ncbi:MAG: carboxypeptidase-like regulatory domain-containing protein, partial [Flavobacteriaceae bacterium]
MKLSNVQNLIILLCSTIGFAQNATISGVVLDENNKPLPNVNITAKDLGTISDSDGFYLLEIIADKENTISFSHVAFKEVVLENLILTTNETFEFNPVLKSDVTQIDGVTVTATGERTTNNILNITPEKIRKIPGAN